MCITAGIVRPAVAAPGIIVGDSIGDDLGRTVGIRSIARTSFSFRRHNIRTQLARVPKGTVVIVSLGLNDGAAPVKHLKPSIERAVLAIQAAGHRTIWIGPPCVLKRWDSAARAQDAYLRQRLAKTAIQYVSLRDANICQRGMRTRDGEHFTPSGYRYVWNKIRRDSSIAASIDMAKSAPVRVSRKATPPMRSRRRRATTSRLRRQRSARRNQTRARSAHRDRKRSQRNR